MKAKLSVPKVAIEAELEAQAQELQVLIDAITPKFVKEGGGILADTVKGWRFANQLNVIKKADKKIKESGLKPHQIPIKTLYPLMEAVALEEDETIQDMWATLLTRAATKDEDIKLYVTVLKELSVHEAMLLMKVYKAGSIEEASLLLRLDNNETKLVDMALVVSSLKRKVLLENKSSQTSSVFLFAESAPTYQEYSMAYGIPPDMGISGKDDDVEKRLARLEREKKNQEDANRYLELTPFAKVMIRACVEPVKDNEKNSK